MCLILTSPVYFNPTPHLAIPFAAWNGVIDLEQLEAITAIRITSAMSGIVKSSSRCGFIL
jgi:hypothetical protein